MHQQLTEKRIACKDLILALEACHADSWARWTGGCNQAKVRLNKCLHEQSMKRAAVNREKAKERRVKIEKVWQEMRDDDA